jgi:hypothetical protein
MDPFRNRITARFQASEGDDVPFGRAAAQPPGVARVCQSTGVPRKIAAIPTTMVNSTARAPALLGPRASGALIDFQELAEPNHAEWAPVELERYGILDRAFVGTAAAPPRRSRSGRCYSCGVRGAS